MIWQQICEVHFRFLRSQEKEKEIFNSDQQGKCWSSRRELKCGWDAQVCCKVWGVQTVCAEHSGGEGDAKNQRTEV